MSTKTPLVDEATRAMKNLGTLRRLDPEIAEVRDTSRDDHSFPWSVYIYILHANKHFSM